MAEIKKINPSSLNMIKTELFASIEQCSGHLEQFISSRDREDFLLETIAGLKQILGVMKLLQLDGAVLLCSEMVLLAESIPVGADEKFDKSLSSLSTGFFVVTRYFEYLQQYGQALPILLLTTINELRQSRKQPPLPEIDFYNVNAEGVRPTIPKCDEQPDGEEYLSLVRRLRHMYEVGLVGIIQDKKASYSLGMMKRAMERMDKIFADTPSGQLWWLMKVALFVMEDKKMSITLPRKFLFSSVDRYLKQLHKKGKDALNDKPAENILKGLLYIIVVSGSDDKSVTEVIAAFNAPPLPYNEAQLQQELENLRGPEMGTVHSVAEVIKEEIRNVKNQLEVVSESNVAIDENYAEIASSLGRVADIMAVVGLSTASNTLREQVNNFSAWAGEEHAATPEELIEAADALLYVESTISNLERINLSPQRLAEANALARDQVISSSQLAEAEKVVLEEAHTGLSLVKRSIASFEESNYDKHHIANLGKSLNAVRGVLVVLNMERAAKICASCVDFVDDTLMTNHEGAIHQMLETFADAVISMEYFLKAYSEDGFRDDNLLNLAEESVQALGYPVS
ncbi:MAG: hypothetical protein KDI30_07750 [Pseudomonadales bacterium]|nr:hypothetical protein [Pseudomonadales bacterium]